MSEHIYEDSDMEHERYHVIPFGSMREEIVRCRDCSKADYAEVHMFDGTRQKKWTCTRFGCFHHMVKPDDFCSRGERREP